MIKRKVFKEINFNKSKDNEIMTKLIEKLLLVIGVVVSFFLLCWGGISVINQISPFSKEVNFTITIVLVLGFYVGAGFTFKKMKLF
jgi:hypothetical protein